MEQYPIASPDEEPEELDEEPIERLPPGGFQNDPLNARTAAGKGGSKREVPPTTGPQQTTEGDPIDPQID